MVNIHREGRATLLIVGGIFIVANIGGAFLLSADSPWNFWILLITATLLVFFLQFFRRPNRKTIEDEGAILAPADGKVVIIEDCMEAEYFQKEMTLVSIFMSPVNMHMNLSPARGEVSYFKYHPGKYLMAFNPKSSHENERTSIGMELKNGHQLLVRQVAGFLARRICCYIEDGQELKQGEEFGFIKFGSRVDVFMPKGTEVAVKKGQMTLAGQTAIGILPVNK